MKFKVGDIVSWCGVKGEIEKVEKFNPTNQYPIKVVFDSDKTGEYVEYFTEEGKLFNWHEESSLVLISSAKRKVTKYNWLYKVRDTTIYRLTASLHENKYRAIESLGDDCMVIGPVKETAIEVEE
jgi:hypothetical protein